MNIKKTANLFINFTLKRLAEIFGLSIFASGILLLLSLLSYSPNDPNFIFPDNTQIKNILGFQGSFISDLFFQSIGLISYMFSITLIITGINIFRAKEFFLLIENIFFTIIYSLFGSLFFSHFYPTSFNLYINGNGGFIGTYLDQTFFKELILINEVFFYYLLIIVNLTLFLISLNFHPLKFYQIIKNTFLIFRKKK